MPITVRALVLALLACVLLALGQPGAAARTHVEQWRVGYDVSHPQCGTELPEQRAFGIVGVNGGLATRPNPCLAEQLVWAAGSSGAVREQPAVQLYVNTANPGEVMDLVTTWPANGETPYGACAGANSLACSWQYGWNRAYVDVHTFFLPAARDAGLRADPAGYRWWLDVETMNTWQYDSPDAHARNRAALEGMVDYLTGTGAEVGVYSTGYQWGRIVGEVGADSSLHGLDSWLAGAVTQAEAEINCARPPLVGGGQVILTQYVTGNLDHNHSCR